MVENIGEWRCEVFSTEVHPRFRQCRPCKMGLRRWRRREGGQKRLQWLWGIWDEKNKGCREGWENHAPHLLGTNQVDRVWFLLCIVNNKYNLHVSKLSPFYQEQSITIFSVLFSWLNLYNPSIVCFILVQGLLDIMSFIYSCWLSYLTASVMMCSSTLVWHCLLGSMPNPSGFALGFSQNVSYQWRYYKPITFSFPSWCGTLFVLPTNMVSVS